MPAPTTNLIKVDAPTAIHIGLEPAHNALNSLLLLNRVEETSGYDQWITQTALAMDSAQRHTNKLVLNGLYYAILPEQSWHSFPEYINFLASRDPSILRDRILNAYDELGCAQDNPYALVGQEALLDDVNVFLAYLQARFSEAYIDVEIEKASHALLREPDKLQTTIVSHLRWMWEKWLAPEWQKKQHILEESVAAFQQMNLNHTSPLAAARAILGASLPDKWEDWLPNMQVDHIYFVPSLHLGPYLNAFKVERGFWLFFGVRLPPSTHLNIPNLSRAELLMRLSALTDDTRLQVLQLVRTEGELCSQDIMKQLELSQSATSRHLKQLSAAGFLSERRHEGAKCYQLNPERVEDTLKAISRFLLH